MKMKTRLKKILAKAAVFTAMFVPAVFTAVMPVAATSTLQQTFKVTAYYNGEWYEGVSQWEYDGIGISGGRSRDYFWLHRTWYNEDQAGYVPIGGEWDNMGMGWSYGYTFKCEDKTSGRTIGTQTVKKSSNTMTAFDGTTNVYYNNGTEWTLTQGHTYKITAYVLNGDVETASYGEVWITIPICTPASHDVKYDLSGGYYSSSVSYSSESKSPIAVQAAEYTDPISQSMMQLNAKSNDSNVATYAINQSGNYMLPDDGEYAFRNRNNGNLYLHGKEAYANDNKRDLTLRSSIWGRGIWYLERYKNTEYYYIINKTSGYALMASGSSASVYPQSKGNGAFLWRFVNAGSGYVAIQNNQYGSYLSTNGLYENGGINLSWNSGWTSNQWSFVTQATGTSAVRTKRQDTNFYVPEKAPAKTGYTFQYWSCSAGGNYYAGQSYNRNQRGGTVTMTAQYTPNKYTVYYESNISGQKKTSTDTATYDQNYLTKSCMFTRTGYTFTGWNTKPDGSGTDWTSWINQPWKWTYTNDVTLYAQWRPNSYTIQYVGNGNTGGSMDPQAVSYDQSATLTKNKFVRDAVKDKENTNKSHERGDFVSWNTKADGSGTKYTDQQKILNLTATDGDVITLYAQWDDAPTLEVSDNAYEQDTNVTVGDMIKDKHNVQSSDDKEDGNMLSKVKIDKIVYPDGTVVNSPKSDVKLKTDESVFVDDENKNQIPIKVTYSVTDSYGHKVSKTTNISLITLREPEEDDSPDDIDNESPKVYNRYIGKGYEWSIDNNSVWDTDSEYQDALNKALEKAK